MERKPANTGEPVAGILRQLISVNSFPGDCRPHVDTGVASCARSVEKTGSIRQKPDFMPAITADFMPGFRRGRIPVPWLLRGSALGSHPGL